MLDLIGAGVGSVEVAVNPQSVSNASITGDAINLAKAEQVDFLISLGAMHDSLDADLTVVTTTDGSSGAAANMAKINYRTLAAEGLWTAWKQVTDSKIDIVTGGEIDPAADDNMILQIRVLAGEIEDVVPKNCFVHFVIGAGGAYAYLVSAVAVVTGMRVSDDIPVSMVV